MTLPKLEDLTEEQRRKLCTPYNEVTAPDFFENECIELEAECTTLRAERNEARHLIAQLQRQCEAADELATMIDIHIGRIKVLQDDRSITDVLVLLTATELAVTQDALEVYKKQRLIVKQM